MIRHEHGPGVFLFFPSLLGETCTQNVFEDFHMQIYADSRFPLVSHMTVPVRADQCGTLSSPRLAKPGVAFCFPTFQVRIYVCQYILVWHKDAHKDQKAVASCLLQ